MGLSKQQEKIKRWRDDPVYFVVDELKASPDAWQIKALTEFGRQEKAKLRLSLQACVGPGKTAVEAWCGWNFLACYGEPGNHPKGAAVSITADNLKDNLWPEFAKWQTRSMYLMGAFQWTKERIFAKHHPETWFISARSWSKKADAEEQGRTLSGLHSKYVLVLIDESGDIPLSVLKAGEQAFSNTDCKFGRILQAGNPTSLDGMLYASATTYRDQWEIVRVTGDPEDKERSPRIDIEWASKQIAMYGRDNPWIMSQILGLFPPASINSLLSVDEIESAMRRHLREDQYGNAQKRLGVDVARFGDDRTIIFPRQGLAAFQPAEMRNARSNEVAARIAMAKAKWGSEIEFIDSTGGYGSGVVDACIQAGLTPVEVNFSGRATDPRYFNKRSEMWFLMAEWIRRGGALPMRPGLARELSVPTYTFVGGKFRLEEKDQIKDRLGFSPDEADALVTTFALADQPAQMSLPMGMQMTGKMVTEYDPFDPLRMAL